MEFLVLCECDLRRHDLGLPLSSSPTMSGELCL
jgi:hypothetical protein